MRWISSPHYNWFRYYSPDLGRYISTDPVGQVGGMNVYPYTASNPLLFADPFGLEVIYNGFVVTNPKVRSSLDRLDRALPNHNVHVTGGDRFVDSSGNVRSATTGEIVPNSRTTTPHAVQNGARAADIKVPGATNDQIRDAAAKSGFPDYNTRQDYDDGHTHVNLPNVPGNHVDPRVVAAFCKLNPSIPLCQQPNQPLNPCP